MIRWRVWAGDAESITALEGIGTILVEHTALVAGLVAAHFAIFAGRFTGNRVAVPVYIAEEIRRTLVGHTSSEADAIGVAEFITGTGGTLSPRLRVPPCR